MALIPMNKSCASSSNLSAYSKWSNRCIIGECANSFIEYYFECMIHSNKHTTNKQLHQIMIDQITETILHCTHSHFKSPHDLIFVTRIIVDFMYNFNDDLIAWNMNKKLMRYIELGNMQWIQLANDCIIKRIHLTKHIASIYFANNQIIRIYPVCVYNEHKIQEQSINENTNINWIIHGILYDHMNEKSFKKSNASHRRLSKLKLSITNTNISESNSDLMITHILCIDYGVIVRSKNGKYGYLESAKMIKTKSSKSVQIRLQKCKTKIFEKNACDGIKCREKPSIYCRNYCCKYHCINQNMPTQCLYHKQHWQSIHPLGSFRVQLRHRWD